MDRNEQNDGDPAAPELRHQRLFEALRVGIVVHEPDTTIQFSNSEALRLLGLTLEEIQGRSAVDPAWQFVSEDGLTMRLEDYPVNRVLSSRQPLSEYVVGVDRSAAADRVWVLVNAYPEFGSDQELERVVVTFVDITARKHAEEALRESEEIFSYFMEYSPMYVFFKDDHLRSLRLSRNFETMLGKPLKDLLGKTMDELFPSDLAKRMMADDMRIIREGQVVTVEEELNGLSYSTTKFPIWVEGVPRYLAGYTIDVTQLKREEKEKVALQEQLMQSQKMESVGRLAGGVAHDFNNMLMGIMGYAELSRDELPAGHPVHLHLDELTRTAQRSADLTRQLLAFASKQAVEPEVLDLNEVIGGMLKLLRRLIGENIDLSWKPAEPLWLVKIDPSQIDQMLMNLCVNARDAINGTGNVIVASANVTLDAAYCAALPEAIPGDYVQLTVRDDGCGIAPADLPHIFEPFFSTKGVGKGSGLGLATVYGTVKQNNGIILVESEAGRGTVLEIYLPRFMGRRTWAAAPKASGAPKGHGETVLLVEDEKALRVTCGRFLTTLGYKTVVAATPADAQDAVAQHPGDIDLLLTDVIMPGMNGQQLAEHLKADKPKLRVLYMSGYAADVIDNQGDADDDIFFISKPFTRDQLARKLREVLDAS